MGQNLRLKLRFTLKDPLIENANYAMFPIHYISTDFGLMSYILGQMALKKRNFDFKTRFTVSSEDEVRIKLAKDYRDLILPKNSPVDKAGYQLRYRFQRDGQRSLLIDREFSLNRVEFTPKEYLQLKDCTEQGEIADKKMIIIKK